MSFTISKWLKKYYFLSKMKMTDSYLILKFRFLPQSYGDGIGSPRLSTTGIFHSLISNDLSYCWTFFKTNRVNCNFSPLFENEGLERKNFILECTLWVKLLTPKLNLREVSQRERTLYRHTQKHKLHTKYLHIFQIYGKYTVKNNFDGKLFFFQNSLPSKLFLTVYFIIFYIYCFFTLTLNSRYSNYCLNSTNFSVMQFYLR